MRKHRPDFAILLLVLALMGIGLVVIYAIGPRVAQYENSINGGQLFSENYYFSGQIRGIIFSLIAMLVGYLLPFEKMSKYSKYAFYIAAFLCFLTGALGRLGVTSFISCDEGACRAMRLPLIGSFQPAEILKIASLLYGAYIIRSRKEKKQLHTSDFWVPIGVIIGVVAFVLAFLEKDFGSTLVIYTMVALMIFVTCNLNWKEILAIIGIAILGIVVLILPFEHRRARLNIYSGNGDTYHIDNSLIGFGTGGFFGTGLGDSIQATGYLPEAPSDSIFSVVGEAWGFFGAMLVLVLFAVLLSRIINVSRRTQDEEQSMVVLGVFAWIIAHVIINVGGVLAIIPMKGITLPFLSHGGTSMMFVSFAVGLTLQISRYTKRETINEDSSSRRGERGTRYAGSRRRT